MSASVHVCNRDMQTQMCSARMQVRPFLQISFAALQVRRSGARAVIFSDGSGMLKAEGLAQSILVSHVRIDIYVRICEEVSIAPLVTFVGMLFAWRRLKL